MAPPVSKGTPILSASELLGQRQETVNRLKGWSALSETQFDVVFLPLILAFAGYVQALPHGEQGTILDVRLQQAERVLRRRRGVILPSGAEPEQIAREEDLWTYAVFSIALLRRLARDIDAWEITLYSAHHQAVGRWTPYEAADGWGAWEGARCYRLKRQTASGGGDWTPLIVRALMPSAALNWLWRKSAVFDVWQKALSRPELPELIQPLFID